MSKGVLVGWLLLVCSCSSRSSQTDPVEQREPPARKPPATAPKTVKVPMFNEVSIADGAIHLMDGGIHGVQGHTVVLAATGSATWERRLDGMQPSGEAGAGQLELTADEAAQVRGWAEGLWALAPTGKASFDPPIEQGPPRWVWAIVLRRGDEVRVLSGGAIASPRGAPDPAKSALEWLQARVDAASGAAP
jgi:hypothetical protein